MSAQAKLQTKLQAGMATTATASAISAIFEILVKKVFFTT